MKNNQLILITISPSRTPQKVWLKFSDGRLLPFSLDDIVILRLKRLQEVTSDLMEKINHASLYFLLLNYALRQLAISPKNRQTLLFKVQQKLRYYLVKYHFPEGNYQPDLDRLFDYLESNNLLSDTAFLQHLIQKYRLKSRREIAFLLKAQSVPFNLQDLPSDKLKIRALLQKKLKSQTKMDQKSKNKLISALVRKGFALPEVKSVIDDLIKF